MYVVWSPDVSLAPNSSPFRLYVPMSLFYDRNVCCTADAAHSGPFSDPIPSTCAPPPPPPFPPSPQPLAAVIGLPQTAVECCGEGGTLSHPFTFDISEDVCGASPQCQSLSWLDAYSHCNGQGGRLCSISDSTAAANSGCDFNKEDIWTQTPCALENGSNSTGFFAILGKKSAELEDVVCHSPEDVMPVSCCADKCSSGLPLLQESAACCGEGGLAWSTNDPNYPDVCGRSRIPECILDATWMEALSSCAAVGARLCTEEDAAAAKNTGCSLNKEYVWTQTPCNDGSVIGFITVKVAGSNMDSVCASPEELRPVRCCLEACPKP
eukprot:scaffold451_cov365-Prasinococcus_capsulatus_cf.AAC.28